MCLMPSVIHEVWEMAAIAHFVIQACLSKNVIAIFCLLGNFINKSTMNWANARDFFFFLKSE